MILHLTAGFLSAALCLFAPLEHSHGQSQAQQDEVIRLRAELLVLDAQVVKKKTGLAVGGLTKDDFLLYEDGVRQHISDFSRDKVPLSVVILLDVSASVTSSKRDAQRLLNGVVEALKQLKPEDEVALIQFAGSASVLQDFTRDQNLIVEGLWRINGRGTLTLFRLLTQKAQCFESCTRRADLSLLQSGFEKNDATFEVSIRENRGSHPFGSEAIALSASFLRR